MEQHPKIQTTADGTLLLNFGEYGQEVEVAAISGDGRRVLTVREVGLAQVWDAVSGEGLGEIRPDSPLQGTTGTAPVDDAFQVFIESAALNCDGTIALLGLNDGTAGMFRVHDGDRIATLRHPKEQQAAKWSVIRAVAFSPDGAFALVGFFNRSAGVWSEDGSKLVALLETPDGSRLVGPPFVRDTLVSSIAMSPDNRWLFAGSVDMTATIWDVTTGHVVFAATEHAEATLSVFDTADGFGWVTTGGNVWRSRHAEPLEKVLNSGEHWSEALSDGTRLLTRALHDDIKQWDLAGGSSPLFTPMEQGGPGWAADAETLAFHGEWLLHPERGRRVTVRRGTERFSVDLESQLVTARFSPAGDAFATEGWRDELDLWSVPSGRMIRKFASKGGVGDFAFSSDGALIAIGEIGQGGGRYTRHVYVYDTATGRRKHVHGEHQWQVSRVEFSPDGECVASMGDEILVWDLERETVRLRITADRTTTGFQFLPDGRLLVVGQGRARVFRADKMILQWPVPVGFETKWWVSVDARTLTVALNQGVVRFDIDSGGLRGTWEAPIARPELVPPPAMAKQIDARTVAALWRTEHGTFVHQSDGPRGWVQPVHISPDDVVAIPTSADAAIIRVGNEPSLLGRVPFNGKLRASRVVDGEVLLVNEQGQLFRQAIST